MPDRGACGVWHEAFLEIFKTIEEGGRSAHDTGLPAEGGLRGLLQRVVSGNESGDDGRSVWIIDNRLAADWISIAALADLTHFVNPDLAIHSSENEVETGALNPPFGIARLKVGLAKKLLASSVAQQCLQENRLASAVAALEDEALVLEWKNRDELRRLFAPGFSRCDQPELKPGIHFPVSDARIHAAICELNLDLAERAGSRVLQYAGKKFRGWFLDDLKRWQHWFGRNEATRVLEVAATDGISTNAMLDLLFPHPESEVHCIHPPGETSSLSESMGRFDFNTRVGNHTDRIHLYTGQSVEVLAWMIAEDGYWESFDFIDFRPGGSHVETMTAIGQAWSLLKPGGVILLNAGLERFGKSHDARPVLETCARVIGNHADPLLSGEIIALKKRPVLRTETSDGGMAE